jgi:hypothetical protein
MIELFHYIIGKCLLKRTTAILPELFYAWQGSGDIVSLLFSKIKIS